jgi:O-antigen/teichoic acid export membrane protein
MGANLKHFSFSVAGSAAFVVQQLIFFVLVQRLLGPGDAGELAVAWALSAPVFLLFTSGMRLKQLGQGTAGATSRAQLDVLRGVGALSSVVCVVALWGVVFRSSTALVVLLGVLAQRLVDLVVERDYTMLQASGRADRAGVLLIVRSVSQAASSTAALYLGASLPWAVLVTAAAGALTHLAQRAAGSFRAGMVAGGGCKVHREVVTACLALGGAGALASAAMNGPRLAIGRVDPALATEFSNLVLPFTVVSLASAGLGVVFLPRLGDATAARDLSRRVATEVRLLRLGVGVAIAGAAFSVVSSVVLIPLVVGPSFIGEVVAVVLTATALLAAVVGSSLQDILTGRGRTGIQPLAFGAAAATGTVATAVLGPDRGVTGAVVGLLLGACVQVTLLWVGVRNSKSALEPAIGPQV